mmetsp:Transcript_56696/g.132502  ORF Transcript_56696/g.132502 Transcript_56696/m.132502 type:complete len:416 (+) Transcript_56696:179-1426(+)
MRPSGRSSEMACVHCKSDTARIRRHSNVQRTTGSVPTFEIILKPGNLSSHCIPRCTISQTTSFPPTGSSCSIWRPRCRISLETVSSSFPTFSRLPSHQIRCLLPFGLLLVWAACLPGGRRKTAFTWVLRPTALMMASLKDGHLGTPALADLAVDALREIPEGPKPTSVSIWPRCSQKCAQRHGRRWRLSQRGLTLYMVFFTSSREGSWRSSRMRRLIRPSSCTTPMWNGRSTGGKSITCCELTSPPRTLSIVPPARRTWLATVSRAQSGWEQDMIQKMGASCSPSRVQSHVWHMSRLVPCIRSQELSGASLALLRILKAHRLRRRPKIATYSLPRWRSASVLLRFCRRLRGRSISTRKASWQLVKSSRSQDEDLCMTSALMRWTDNVKKSRQQWRRMTRMLFMRTQKMTLSASAA